MNKIHKGEVNEVMATNRAKSKSSKMKKNSSNKNHNRTLGRSESAKKVIHNLEEMREQEEAEVEAEFAMVFDSFLDW